MMQSRHTKEKLQLVNELHKPARKNFKRRRTIIKGLDDVWQLDLAEMGNYAKNNKNFKYILVVIDCFSKFLWTRPIKTKSGEEVMRAFNDILEKSKRVPKNLQSDQGKEFYNVHFKNLMKTHNINHYSTYSIKKAAIAERVIRTIKEKLYKYFSLNGTYKWIDVLDEITNNYNKQKHRTIAMRPCDVSRKNEKQLLTTAYSHVKLATDQRKFKVGDYVRISKNKHVFEKGYTPNWTTEIFKVVKVHTTNPVTYILKDLHGRMISGGFYMEELQLAKNSDIFLVERIVRRRGKKVLVKWLGFDETHNSWIDNTNIF